MPLSRIRDLIREENILFLSKLQRQEKNDEDDETWFNTAEAIVYTKSSRTSLQTWRSEGRLPFSKIGAHTIRYRKSDLDKFLAGELAQ